MVDGISSSEMDSYANWTVQCSSERLTTKVAPRPEDIEVYSLHVLVYSMFSDIASWVGTVVSYVVRHLTTL